MKGNKRKKFETNEGNPVNLSMYVASTASKFVCSQRLLVAVEVFYHIILFL
jgi:hypothetical protein